MDTQHAMDISNLLEVEVKEGKPSELSNNGETADYQNMPDISLRDIASVRFRKLHCTACDIHIGSAPADAHNMHEHPVLHVLLCTNCRNFYGDGNFEQGDDATDMFCRWCANGGQLYCCSYCSNTFCYKCIRRNFDPLVRKKIERDEKWKCFVCNPSDLYSARSACWALLQHVQTVTRILQSDTKMSLKEVETKMNLDESQCCLHKKNKRKRTDTGSEEDETYTIPKRKRRKFLNAKRSKRRIIKLEMPDNKNEELLLTEGADSDEESVSHHGDSGLETARQIEEEVYTNRRSESQRCPDAGKSPSPEDLPLAFRQKRRPRSTMLTDEVDLIRSNVSIQDDDIPAPLLQCDQSMVEGPAGSVTFGISSWPGPDEGVRKVPGFSNTDPTVMPVKVRFNSGSGISPIPTANLLKRQPPDIRGVKNPRFIRSIGGAPVLVRKLTSHQLTNSQKVNINAKPGTVGQSVPMVSIPSRNHLGQSLNRINVIQPPLQSPKPVQNSSGNPMLRPVRPLFVLQQTNKPSVAANTKARNDPPSVINLDSDSDESVVIDKSTENRKRLRTNDRVPKISTPTFPTVDDGTMTILTLRSRRDTDEIADNETSNPKTPVNVFEQTEMTHTKTIDAVLVTLKSQLKKILESATFFSTEKDLLAARAKTKAIHRSIKRTVTELTSLNDNLIRAYRAYKSENLQRDVNHTPLITLRKKQKSIQIIPLDMECIRESEPEVDDAISEDDEDSENTNKFGPIRDIRPFRRNVNRAVEVKPKTMNKSVQVYDNVIKDCEKSIGYALLLKADYDAKRERDVLRPVRVPDENFGKYEEQFIYYLQHIEDHGIETEETKEMEEPISVSVKEVIDLDMVSNLDKDQETNVVPSKEKEDKEKPKETDDKESTNNLDVSLEILTMKSTSSSDSELDDPLDKEKTDNNAPVETADTAMETIDNDQPLAEETHKDSTVKEKPDVGLSIINENETTEEKNDSETVSEVTEATKKSARIPDEETILAVRALIDSDTSDSNNDVLHARRPLDTDDECTILD